MRKTPIFFSGQTNMKSTKPYFYLFVSFSFVFLSINITDEIEKKKVPAGTTYIYNSGFLIHVSSNGFR